MTYELPADSYDGRVELQTLARRIARACVHFLQVSTPFAHCAAAGLSCASALERPPLTLIFVCLHRQT